MGYSTRNGGSLTGRRGVPVTGIEKIPGTFDWFDLLFLGIGAFVEGLLYKKFILRRIV
jgi:hypothetical protein